MLKATWVTTEDNPYDYFDDFDNWYQFDVSHGYDTCGYMARLLFTSPELSPALNASETERCVDEVIKFNLTGNYKKVERMVEDEYFEE
jgi:hypothetical protein